MNNVKRKSGFKPLADTALGILDPVLRKRAGMNLSLIQNWDAIIGAQLAAQSRPLKILWPRRASDNDPFQPATLVIACQGFAAMKIQHETGEIISRVNSFLGFAAIGRVRIEQKSVEDPKQRVKKRPVQLAPSVEKQINQMTADVEDDSLRQALARLGKNIAAEKLRK